MKRFKSINSLIHEREWLKDKRALYSSLVLIILLIIIWFLAQNSYHNYLLEERREQLKEELVGKGYMITRQLAARQGLIHGLDAFVKEQLANEMDFSGFYSFASGIYVANEGIGTVNIAPRGTIQYVYPRAQAGTLMGYSLINDPRRPQRIDIQRAMMTKEPVVSGPLDFITGGSGLAIRKAVYFNGDFWGIVSITLKLDYLLKDAGINYGGNGIKYAIKEKEDVFFGQEEVFNSQPVIHDLDIPHNDFQIAAIPEQGWEGAIGQRLVISRIISIALAIMAFFLAHTILCRNIQIQNTVKRKTIDLNRSNELLEQQLRRGIQLEFRLKKAQTMAQVGNWQLDLTTGEFWSSDEAIRIFGFEENLSFVSFESFESLINREDRQSRDKSLKQLMKSGEDYHAEYRINRYNDNEERFVRGSAEAVMDSEGNVQMLLGVLQDITEQNKAKRALAESERTLSALMANLPGMAYRRKHDQKWTMEFVSQGCFELTGYLPSDLIMNNTLSFYDMVKEEHRQFLWEAWNLALSERMTFREEYVIVTARGEERWVWEQGQAIFDNAGKLIAIEGFITDLTERKNKEEEITYLSYHDIVTGLYNRRYFEEAKEKMDSEEWLPLSVIMADINGLKLVNDTMGHAQGDKLLSETAKILKDLCREGDVLARVGGDEFCILLPKTDADQVNFLMDKIVAAFDEHKQKSEMGSIFTGVALGFGTKTSIEESLDRTIGIAEDFMYRRKLLQSQSLHSSLVNSMKTALSIKSHETDEHANRLANLSTRLGKRLGLNKQELAELELLSKLHDIGKIVINDNILNKPGKLDEDEFEQMKKHAEIGYRIVRFSPELKHISNYILTHHEHWNGRGYPQGLKGEEIPLLSRILSIVDAYDAMTNDRAYRKAMPKKDALEEIRNNEGSQFDPHIAEVFIKMMANSIK